MESEELTHKIIGAAMRVYNTLGSGFLESVYENALAYEVGKLNLVVELQCPITVLYEGVIVGQFRADMLVEKEVIVELKAVETIAKIHEVQLVNYLNATGIEVGLLINFSPKTLEFRRRVRHLSTEDKHE